MSYWGQIAKSAARRAAKDLRLDSAMGVAIALLAQLVIGVLIYWTLGQAETNFATRAATAAAPFLLLPIVWFVRFLAEPARLDSELRAQIKKLDRGARYSLPGGYKLVEDTPLETALAFAVTGTWDAQPDYDGADLGKLEAEVEAFMRLARNNHIRVWYRPYATDPHCEKLDGAGWSAHRIDFVEVAAGRAAMRRRQDGSELSTCHGLFVCKAEWDARWAILREHET